MRFGVLVFLLAASCSGPKSTADADISAAAGALAALPADAAQVAPDWVGPLTDALSDARQQAAKGDYPAASASAHDVPAKARQLADSLPALRIRLSAEMDTLSIAMPRNLAAIKAKLDGIAKARRLPRGLDQQQLQAAKDTYGAATAEWADITASFKAGQMASAMAKAHELKVRVSRSLAALGLVADERAWTNVTLPPK